MPGEVVEMLKPQQAGDGVERHREGARLCHEAARGWFSRCRHLAGGLLVVSEPISPQSRTFLFPGIGTDSLLLRLLSLRRAGHQSRRRPQRSRARGGRARKCFELNSCPCEACPSGREIFFPPLPFLCHPRTLPRRRLPANGVELVRALSINGAEYKQNKAFISRAVISLLIYFTVHRLFICFHVFSAGVICGAE